MKQARSDYPQLDDIDRRILWKLDHNARQSRSVLAQSLGVSKQLFSYRVKKLEQALVIKNYIAIIDVHRLGLMTFRVYLRFKNMLRSEEQEVIKYFCAHQRTLWVGSISGLWDMEVVFTARNFIDFNFVLKQAQQKLGDIFQKINLSCSPVSYHFRRDYLVQASRNKFTNTYYGFEPGDFRWDKFDFRLLASLSHNCYESYDILARKLGLSSLQVRRRIDALEAGKILRGYRLRVDLNSLGRRYVKALVTHAVLPAAVEREFYRFCASRSFVVYLTEVMGDWQLEIEAEVIDQNELLAHVSELRRRFSQYVLDYELIEVIREHKINYLPTGEDTLQQMSPVVHERPEY